MKGVVIYAHYDSNNIIADYVIQGLKSLVYIGYDILFYTASSSINNIDVSILPFEIHFVQNKGAGTDWAIWLNGLNIIKENKLNYEWIMFINDSLLFPINGITNFMNSIITIRETCDFWGHWLSPEINLHLVGTPIEFKYNLIDDIITFIKNNIPLCKNKMDFIYKIETKFTQYLFEQKYKMNSIIKYTDFKSDTRYVQCPMFNKKFLKNWVNETKTFAIKWKYCISNLTNDDVSHEFNFLSKYLYYGKYGILSPIKG
jgi:lipopolysaccharide biosynthesis protein